MDTKKVLYTFLDLLAKQKDIYMNNWVGKVLDSESVSQYNFNIGKAQGIHEAILILQEIADKNLSISKNETTAFLQGRPFVPQPAPKVEFQDGQE